jgi:hypothetical protein
MERFREHEKQFKQKKFSKKSLLDNQRQFGSDSDSQGSNRYDSDNDDDDDYGNEDGSDQDQLSEEESEEKIQALKAKDREYLGEVLTFMKEHVGNIENELETLRKKKGPPKKQKEK